jgi:DeoR family transcriptional regulator, ulaG and ulaABCDEF operon transcriptional repressor
MQVFERMNTAIVPMHEQERRAAILEAIKGRTVLSLRELGDVMGVSSATLRRDVTKLEDEGLVRRVHGGVAAPEEAPLHLDGAPSFLSQRVKNWHKKRAIAEMAAGLCADGESIIINGGTTTYAMVDFLRDRRLNILTNSFPIAEALIKSSQNRITLPGGEIYREQGIVLSPFDDDTIQNVHATTMFLSAMALTALGMVEGDPLIARAEAKLFQRADRLVALIDSSKFMPRGNMVVCPLSRVSLVITDDGVSEHALEMLNNAGVSVRIAPVQKEIASAA